MGNVLHCMRGAATRIDGHSTVRELHVDKFAPTTADAQRSADGPNGSATIEDLPEHLAHEIFDHLDVKDLLRATATSRSLRDAGRVYLVALRELAALGVDGTRLPARRLGDALDMHSGRLRRPLTCSLKMREPRIQWSEAKELSARDGLVLSAIPHYHPPLESSLFTIGGHRETRFDVAKWVVMDASRELVVAGTTDGAVLTYDRTTGAALDVCANLSQHTPEGNKHVICIRLDGPHIFATGNDRSAVIFLDGRPTLNVERSTNYDMRGNILVTTPRLNYRNEGSLYNLKTGEHIFLPRQPFSIKLVSVGEHAVALVTEGLEKGERQLRLLNHKAELIHVIDAHDGRIWSLVSDDMSILSGSADGTARLWDQKTGQRMQTLQHGECVRAVALRGNLAATGSNYSVKLWDRSNGALRQTLHRSERLTSLTLGDDGVIVTGPSTLETWRHSKRPAAT